MTISLRALRIAELGQIRSGGGRNLGISEERLFKNGETLGSCKPVSLRGQGDRGSGGWGIVPAPVLHLLEDGREHLLT